MADFFDDISNETNSSQEHKPFFCIDKENEKALLDWLKEEMMLIKTANDYRFDKIKNNFLRYKGIQYREQVHTPRDQEAKRTRYMPQVVLPLIYDTVEEKVSRMMEKKPSVAIIPVHDEESDKVDAKIAKRFLSHVDYIEKLDRKWQSLLRISRIAGESFMVTCWDPDKGDIHPSLQKLKAKAGDQDLEFDMPIYVGDVSVKPVSPLSFLYERADCWENVNHGFLIEWVYTEELKTMYPSKKDKIKSDARKLEYDFEKMEEKSQDGKTMKITFWHRKTKFVPDGFECVFTGECILKSSKLPYGFKGLPVERLPDITNELECSGESSIEKIRGLVAQVNNMNNMVHKQTMLCAHPKWFVDAGSVNETNLGNDTAIVSVKAGANRPVLAQANPVSPQVFEQIENNIKRVYQFSKSNSVVQGEPPTGVTAFVALQYVSESENRRMNTDVANFESCIRAVYDKVLNICGQYYKKSDKRTMMILGKDNRWNAMKYDPESLAKPYSVVIHNQSALPDSKAARTQFILDMSQRYPDLFPKEQVLEMLDFAQSDKFMDVGASAARSAEQENEEILDGKQAKEPEEFELHHVHYGVHVRAMQDYGLKANTDPQIVQLMKDHLMATEYLMMEQTKKNPAYAQLIMQMFPFFPMVMDPGVDLDQKVAMEQQAQAQAAAVGVPPAPQQPAGEMPVPGQEQMTPQHTPEELDAMAQEKQNQELANNPAQGLDLNYQ
jgi:hypothetical protein